MVVPGFPHTTEPLGGTDWDALWSVGLVLWLGMCVVGLLFENYIVNASIFIRSNFFEIIEPGSDTFWVLVFMVLSISMIDQHVWSSF